MTRLTILLVSLLTTAVAAAQPRVALDDIEGPRGNQARRAVEGAIESEVELVPMDDVIDAADGLGVSLADADGRVAVARKLQLSAFVVGSVRKAGSRLELTLTVRNGADGSEVGDAQISGRARRFGRRVGSRAWPSLQPLIAQTAPPAEDKEVQQAQDEEEPGIAAAELEADLSSDDDDDEDEGAPPDVGDLSGVVFDIGFGLGARRFGYPDAANLDGLPRYTLAPWGDQPGVVPNVDLALQVYPMLLLGEGGVLANIGLDLRYQLVFGIDSEDVATGTKYDTNAGAWSVDARMRFPLPALEPAVFLGYGKRRFELEGNPVVPAVDYGSLRFGGDLRYTGVSSVPMQLRLGMLLPMGFGGIADDDWFPDASGLGMLLEMRVGYTLSPLFEPFLALGYERYGLSLDPKPGGGADQARRVAGGVLDEYYQLLLGYSLHF